MYVCLVTPFVASRQESHPCVGSLDLWNSFFGIKLFLIWGTGVKLM